MVGPVARRRVLLLLALLPALASCVAPFERAYRPPAGRVLFSQAGLDLWESAPDGGRRHQLTFDGAASGSGYTGGRWSPDGSLIAAERNLAAESGTGLFLVDPAARTSERLTTANTFLDGYAWSPDGRYLAFGELTSGGTPGPGGGVIGAVGDVVLYDVRARTRRALAPGTHPSFSADGRQVGFAHASGTVALADVATGALTHLVSLADLSRYSAAVAPRGMGLIGGPVWSSDGGLIAYAAIERGPILEALQIVYVQEPKPGAPPKHWVLGKTGAVHHVAELRWSPAKPLLGYSIINAQPHHHWFGVIDPADPKLRELHDSVQHFIDFTWAPDGHAALVQLDDEDAWAIFRPERAGIAYRREPGGWRPDWCRCP
jgi:dipeptidyl aminopeptidase/acylaminoacyl peptidase